MHLTGDKSNPGARARLGTRRFFAILLLGFSSGLPLLLVGGTLRYWLADAGVNLGTIGLFALVSLPYALKFLWAPAIDRLRLPWLSSHLGRRHAWGLPIQVLLAACLIALARLDPGASAITVAEMAVAIAFLSASQDVVIDALRIEMLTPDEYALGNAVTTLGYRIGMLAAGAGALYLAQYGSWPMAYNLMALLMIVGMAGFAIAPEGTPVPARSGSLALWLKEAVAAPFADFMRRPGWVWILVFIMVYKLAPVLALGMTSPFYKEMGFVKSEVAGITKVFGLAATIAGGFAGAYMVRIAGLWRTLLWAGIAQALALYGFYAVARAGHDPAWLTFAIGAENLTGAMAAIAVTSYISILCNKQFTATQFALLTAVAAVSGDTLSGGAGYLVQTIGWQRFFLLVPLASLPGLILLTKLKSVIDENSPYN